MYVPTKWKKIIKKYPPLDEDKILLLINLYKLNNNTEALHSLYLHNLRYIVTMCKQWVTDEDNFDDLMNNIYLIMDAAVNNYDINFNVKFLTYLKHYIFKICKEYASSKGIVNAKYIIYPFITVERFIDNKAYNDYIYLTKDDAEYIAEATHVPLHQVLNYFKYNGMTQDDISLNDIYDDTDEGINLIANDNDEIDLDFEIRMEFYKNKIKEKYPKHYHLMMDYLNNPNISNESLGNRHNVTSEGARQIIKRLKHIKL
ncbi:hypothetical protein NPQ18_04385 [Galbibacter orientalis]